MFWVYFVSILISIALVVPSCFCETPFFTILSSIGCSGIAASIMAIFLEKISQKKEAEKKEQARNIYFRRLKDEFKMMFERIIWFDDRMSDTPFDWGQNPKVYLSLKYMIDAGVQYAEYKLTYADMQKRLSNLEIKYNQSGIQAMSDEEKEKTERMFRILAASSWELERQTENIEKNKLVLSAEDYLTLTEIEDMTFYVSFAVLRMNKPRQDYQIAIQSLQNAYSILEEKLGKEDSFNIGLHGTVPASDV